MSKELDIKRKRYHEEEPSVKIYENLIGLVKDMFSKGERSEPFDGREVVANIDRVVDKMMMGDEGVISLTMRATQDNYLYAHSVNVCLYSIKIGLGLGYDKSQLNELGVASLLHDVGMVKVEDISQLHRKLTKKEYESVKQHPIYGAEILEALRDLTKVAIYVAREHHERVDETGYPHRLKDGQISEYARIVGLVDVYEALTHPRPYRKNFLSYEAIEEILKNKAQFDQRFLKILLKELTIYPVGTWVLLNSREIGKVVKINKSSPLRPKVELAYNSNGRKLREIKSIDLSRNSILFITKCLRDSELKSRISQTKS